MIELLIGNIITAWLISWIINFSVAYIAIAITFDRKIFSRKNAFVSAIISTSIQTAMFIYGATNLATMLFNL